MAQAFGHRKKTVCIFGTPRSFLFDRAVMAYDMLCVNYGFTPSQLDLIVKAKKRDGWIDEEIWMFLILTYSYKLHNCTYSKPVVLEKVFTWEDERGISEIRRICKSTIRQSKYRRNMELKK